MYKKNDFCNQLYRRALLIDVSRVIFMFFFLKSDQKRIFDYILLEKLWQNNSIFYISELQGTLKEILKWINFLRELKFISLNKFK